MSQDQDTTLDPRTDASGDGHSLWSELRDAIRGTNADYTKIPLRRAVFLLYSIAMVLAHAAGRPVFERRAWAE